MQTFVDVLLRHKANQKRNRIINIVSIVQTIIYKYYCNSNAQKLQVSMKLEPCTTRKSFLNRLYSFKSMSLIDETTFT